MNLFAAVAAHNALKAEKARLSDEADALRSRLNEISDRIADLDFTQIPDASSAVIEAAREAAAEAATS